MLLREQIQQKNMQKTSQRSLSRAHWRCCSGARDEAGDLSEAGESGIDIEHSPELGLQVDAVTEVHTDLLDVTSSSWSVQLPL